MATFTWTPVNNSTAPPPVIVTETTSSGWGANDASGTGDYSNPYGFPEVPAANGHGKSETGIWYSERDGASSILITVSLTADASGPASGSGISYASDSVAYSAYVSPVTMSLSGTLTDNNKQPILDSSGNQQILVGQQCTAAVIGIPSGNGWSATYSWNVSGTTFESWSVTTPKIGTAAANSQASYYDPGPIPATNSTHWYWNDAQGATETVKCTVMVTPPAGQGKPFTLNLTAPQSVTVYVPGFKFIATPGYMQINTKAYNQGGALDLYAGPPGGGSGGIVWDATCTTPPLFGKGSVELIQIVTPNLSYTEYAGMMKVGPQHNDPQNGLTGLDGQCPYPGSSYTEGGPDFTSNDSPTAPLSNSMGSIIMTHQFKDYLMYIPPGSSQVVPLATLTWGLNMTGSAIIPSTVNWADYAKQNGTDSAGTVTTTASQATNKFPSWTLIDGPQPINSF